MKMIYVYIIYMNANVDVQCWVQTFVDAFAHQTTCSDESMGEGGRMDLLTGKKPSSRFPCWVGF